MGLDITAYRKLKALRAKNGDEWDFENEASLYDNPSFPGRSSGVNCEMIYSFAEKFGFAAGSYGGYGEWRDWLTRLTGAVDAEGIWQGPDSGPFYELINFADNEGTIGPTVAAKLLNDFEAFDDKARRNGDEWEYVCYKNWRKAMALAADGGAVSFH